MNNCSLYLQLLLFLLLLFIDFVISTALVAVAWVGIGVDFMIAGGGYGM